MNEEEKKARDLIDGIIKQLSMDNYKGNIKAIAVVSIDNNLVMKTHCTMGPNLAIALVGAVDLLSFEIKNVVQKEFRKETPND